MIIDAEDHILTISLAYKMLMALKTFQGVNDNTEIEFHYYEGSGWTVSVDQEELEDARKPKPSSGILPNITLTPDYLKPPFTINAETK